MAEMRLQKYLSRAGVAARRKAEELIESGAVAVNGKVVTRLGTKVDPAVDRVSVDGQAVYPQDLFYVLLNKPKGCISAVSDPQGRKTVMEYLQGVPVRVAPVGRLDFYSEGVLLLTNDGELSARLQSPAYKAPKTYHVKVRGTLREAELDALRTGVVLDDGTRTRPAQVDRLRAASRHDWLVITLTEGKNRQIHRMLESLGHQVVKLQRVAFAGLTYEGLRVGDARELTQSEVNTLRVMVELDKSPVARGAWRSKRENTDDARRARARVRGSFDAVREARLQGKKPTRSQLAAARAAGGADAPPRGRTARGPDGPPRGAGRGTGGTGRSTGGAGRGTGGAGRGTGGAGRSTGGTGGAGRGPGARPASGGRRTGPRATSSRGAARPPRGKKPPRRR